MITHLPLLQRFKICRELRGHDSIAKAATFLAHDPKTSKPYSQRWIREAIVYKDKNPVLHESVVVYCQEAALMLSEGKLQPESV